MKLLITGSRGQLGTELQRQARDEIVAADVEEVDITELDSVRSIIKKTAPDGIINCAAYTNVDKCETDRDAAFAVNALGARNLAIAASECCAKLIHISTDYVFDGSGSEPRREWDLPNPQSVYGYTKLTGEQYVRQFCPRSFIVRTAWLYGYVGTNFVKTILNAAKSGKPLKVVDDQRGNPTSAVDLTKHLLKLISTEEFGIYHCTNNGECSWYEFADRFLGLSGLKYTIEPCTTEEFPRPAKRPAYSSLDNMMLRLTIGDEMRSWQDAVAEYIEHYNRESGEFEL
ncbi:NAD(P)-dependent oxidoreductase [Spirochaetia bacterium]|nr:NAD(P)-dependent oxidoreductase [Spirochaetia bacterium]